MIPCKIINANQGFGYYKWGNKIAAKGSSVQKARTTITSTHPHQAGGFITTGKGGRTEPNQLQWVRFPRLNCAMLHRLGLLSSSRPSAVRASSLPYPLMEAVFASGRKHFRKPREKLNMETIPRRFQRRLNISRRRARRQRHFRCGSESRGKASMWEWVGDRISTVNIIRRDSAQTSPKYQHALLADAPRSRRTGKHRCCAVILQ